MKIFYPFYMNMAGLAIGFGQGIAPVLLAAGLHTNVGDHDFGAGGGQRADDTGANAARTAGDQRYFPLDG